MEHEHVETETEKDPHEILPEHLLSEKSKKLKKPRVHKEEIKTEESIQDLENDTLGIQQLPKIEQNDHTAFASSVDEETEESSDTTSTIEIKEDNTQENDIPPIKQIRNLLTDFEMRVPVWGLTVFTVDGYILAHRLFYEGMPENLEMVVSSMSAGLITISQDFIRLVASNSRFRQVLVDADDDSGSVSFSVMLKHIAENVMLTCIFPSNVKLGLVAFEIENLSNDISEIVGLWDVKLHEETVT